MMPVTALAEETGEQTEETPVCICTEQCTEESINADCPVCGVEGADLSLCAAEKTESEKTESEPDEAVENVQSLIDALPAAADLESMGQEEQQTVYEHVQAAYDAYDALTDEQKEQITGEKIFDALFAAFDGMVATAADNVTYLDEDGNTQTCTSATNVSDTDTTWNEGWYVVDGTVQIDNTIEVSGNVNLILADNSTLTINCTSGNGILVDENASLTVYAQSKTDSAGILTANSSQDRTPGIKSNGGALTLVGAKVNSSYISFTDTDFTVKSGATVTVDGRDSNYQGISYTNGTMEIIDSTVRVTHYRNNTGTGIYGNQKINTSGPKGTLIVRGNSTLDVKSDKCGLDIEVLEVYGGQVDVQVLTTAAVSNGAIDAYDITVSGGSLTAKAEINRNTDWAVTASAFNMTGGVRSIAVTDGKLTGIAKGPSYVECIQGGGTADLNIRGGEVYLEATADKYSAYGARIKRYTITGGSCTSIANSNQSPTESAGLYANFGYNISGGTTTTMGDGWAFYQQFKPTVSESFRHITYGNTTKNAENAQIIDETQSDFDWNNYKYIRIEPKPKNDQTEVPDAPTLKSVTSNSVTLDDVTSTGQGDVQYGYITGTGTAEDITNWQTSTTFNELSAGTDYIFYTRYAGNEEYNPFDPSATGLTVTTLPEITTTSLDAGKVGVKYEKMLTANAASGKKVTWTLADNSTLPAGLTLNSDGTITGTPTTTASSHSFTVQATIEGADSTEQVSNTAILSITINAGTPVITANAYNGTTQTSTFAYGDTITINGTIAASTTASGTSTNSITQNQVGLYLGDSEEELATANVTDNSFTLTYDTAGKGIPVGESQTLTVRYGGSGDLTTGSTTVNITLNKKSVTAQVQGDITKVYDGDAKATVNLTITKVNENDDITVTAPNAVYNDVNVGENKTITLGSLTVAGNDANWYTVSPPENVTGSITNAKLSVPNVTWNGTTASWNAVNNADSYSVTLYLEQGDGDPDTEIKTITTNSTSCNFSDDITEAGSYYVSVTAKGSGNYSDSDPGKSSAVTYYNVSVSEVTGGSATASRAIAMSGTTITLKTTASQGYNFWKWTTEPVDLSITKDTSNADTWMFTMPEQHVGLTPVFEAAPVAPAVIATVNGESHTSGTWTSGDVTFTVSDSTADSGIAGYQYSTDNGASWHDMQTSQTGQLTASLTVSDESTTEEGTSYLFRAVSEAGTAGANSDSFVVKIDKVSPGITVTGANTTGYHQDADITITPSAGLSDVSEIEVSSDNGSTWEDITDSYQSGYKVTANGTYTFRVTNGAGVTETGSITYKNIDTSKPVAEITATLGGGAAYQDGKWTNQDVTLSVRNTNTENLGASTYQYKINDGQWQDYTDAITFSNETDGTVYTFRAISESKVVSDEKSITVKLDKTAPADLDVSYETDSFREFMNDITFGLFFKDTVEVTISAADAGSGVDEISYRLSEGSLQTVTADENGTVTFYVEPQFKGNISDVSAKDNAGNSTSDRDYEYFAVDSETPGAPEVSAKSGESAYTSDEWTDSDVTITLSGSAADSGIAKYQYSTDNGATWNDIEASKITDATGTTPANVTEAVLQVTARSETAEGTTYLFRAVSNSGMEGTASETLAVKIDKTAPAVSVSGNNDAYLQSDTVKITASAGASSIVKVEVSKDGGEAVDITDSYADGYRVTENGTYKFTITNGAGVTASDSIQYDKLDSAKPEAVIDSGSYTDGRWTNGDVTLSVSNSTSNLGRTELKYKVGNGEWQDYTDTLTISDDTDVNGVTYTFKAISANGVESNEVSITVKVDKTAPDGEIRIGENGWKNFLHTITFGLFFHDTQTVSIDSTDALSGVATVEYASSREPLTLEEVQALTDWTEGTGEDVTPEDGKQFIYYARITDHAGNVICLSTDGAEYDLTAPVISGISDQGTYCISAEFTVNDKHIDTAEVDGKAAVSEEGVYTLVPGQHTVIVVDKAGNTTEVNVTVNENHRWENGQCTVCGSVCQHTGGTATCKDQAVCEICGEAYGELDSTNHTNLIYVDAKEATHLEEGNEEYWYCDGCGKYFSDAAGTEETALEKITIPKKTEHTADGTGWHMDEDSHWHTCECGETIDQADHTFEWVTDQEASATEAGSRHEECTVCGYQKEAVEIPATGTPTEPSDPTEPGEPFEPSEPTEPGTPSEPSDPSEPGEPSEPSEPYKSTGTKPGSGDTAANDAADDAASVATGDNSNSTLWVSVMLASGVVLIGTVVYSRKKNKR